MQGIAQVIDHCLKIFRRGDVYNAFLALLEMEHGILPDLMAEFQAVTSRLIGIDSRGSLHVGSLPLPDLKWTLVSLNSSTLSFRF